MKKCINQTPWQSFHVLDLASTGTAAKAYLNERNIRLRAISPLQKKPFAASIDNLLVEKMAGRLPDCLKSEEAGKYSHVHLHMLLADRKTKLSASFANTVLSGVYKALAPGGLFFFTSDDTQLGFWRAANASGAFSSCGMRALLHFSREKNGEWKNAGGNGEAGYLFELFNTKAGDLSDLLSLFSDSAPKFATEFLVLKKPGR